MRISYQGKHLNNTHVAFPSRRNTQLKVSSSSAEVIFRDTGFKVNVKDCCVGSTLAYFRIFILAEASTRFFPICGTCVSIVHKREHFP